MPKLLLAASTGGHLAQLVRLAPRLGATEDSLWITFENEQSKKLLAGKRVHYVDYIRPRGFVKVIEAFISIQRLLKTESFDAAYSTGAGLALAALPAARVYKIPSTYIESVSRFEGPSVTGRILAASRMVKLRTQHQAWASSRWTKVDSVLNEFETAERARSSSTLRLFVTLGTIKPYRFDALVDRIKTIATHDLDITWQLGETSRADLPGSVHQYMGSDEFERVVNESDVVITHAGVGTILNLLDLGKFPVAVPRRPEFGEHVDGHQRQVCKYLDSTGLGAVADVSKLTLEVIEEASRKRVVYAGQG